jgi:hypothetical protein
MLLSCLDYVVAVIDEWISMKHWWKDAAERWRPRTEVCPGATLFYKFHVECRAILLGPLLLQAVD